MRSLAASSFRVEGGETYDRFGDQPSPNRFGDQPSPNRFGDQPSPGAAVVTAAGRPVRPPGRIRGVLCLYCRTEKFVYWPPASRLRLADCPGCQRWTPMPCTPRA